MFPSMNNLYPSFYNNHSPCFTTSLETNNIFLQNHLEYLSNYNNNYLRTSNNNNIHPILENPTNIFSLQAPIIDNPSSNVINKKVSSKNRGIVKRDRHTKIWTAQGIRDRRVRLSINIAREFFNLQDILGFDKASKTVGWLLEKSKDAIHELTTTTSTPKPSLFSPFDRGNNNVIPRNYEISDVFGVDKLEDSSKNAVSKKRRVIRPQHQLQPQTDDQSVALKTVRRARRARARDRARERTKNKKTTTTLHNHLNNHTHLESLNQEHHQIIDQQSKVDDEQLLNDELIFHQLISGCSPPLPSISCSTLMACGGINKDVSVRESVVIKSKSRDHESSLNYNFNDMITKDNYDLGYDYYHNNFTPGLSSALNIINLSKEIHINGKPWDDYCNQDLH